MKKSLTSKIFISLICLIFIIATFIGSGVLSMNVGKVSAASSGDTYKINIESDFNDPNKPKYSSNGAKDSNAYDLYEAQALHNVKIAAEGIVLMENKNNFLPMEKNNEHENKISIFGKKSADYSYGPLGAGDATKYSLLPWGAQSNSAPSEQVTLYEAFSGLDTYGNTTNSTVINCSYVYPQELLSQSFEINPTLVDFYNDDEKSPATEIVHGSGGGELSAYIAGLPVGETPIQYYTQEVKDSFASYNDAAIVVLNRVGAEGSDVPKTMLENWNGKDDSFYADANKVSGARHWDDHYLQLDANEVAMLQMVMDNFENIIILCNTNSQIELGFMDDPGHYLFSDNNYATTYEEKVAAMNKLKAALFIGYPGTFGAAAIPQILDGTVNPSGKLADTWMRDFKLDPTWQNQGFGEKVSGCSTNSGNSTAWSNNFVHYDEDIYLGYRYYETRYYEEDRIERVGKFTTSGNTETNNGSITDQSFSTTTTEWESWYDAAVSYPFGHGLSYTEFEWSEISVTTSDGGALTTDGTVTATVKVTNTGDFAGKDVVQLYFSAPYYDGEIQKAHVVLGGFGKTDIIQPGKSQTLTITMPVEYMKSYDWNDANGNDFKGYEMDEGDYYITLASDAHAAAELIEKNTVKFTLGSDLKFAKDLKTGTEVTNQFDYVSGTDFTNSEKSFKGVKQYMMRNDFAGTWPTHTLEKKAAYKRDGVVQSEASTEMSEERDKISPWYSDVEYPNQATKPGNSVTNEIKLWHMTGRDLDDPLWEKFLDQFTPQEMAVFVGTCNYTTAAIPSIDKPTVKDNDGALGVKACVSIQWPSNPVVAQTFNTALTYTQGRLYANSAFFETANKAQGGIYGTGLETHRSPFAGRNAEYYSEDPILGGLMCAPYMKGANHMGVFLTLKHFGLNNCDTMRGSMCTWASEQAIREIYVKAYEIVVKDGYTTSIMSAVNLIGDIGAITNYPLLTQLLRNEWGFEGFVISDMTPRDPDYTIRAGNDLMLLGSPNLPSYEGELSTTQLHALRTATKNIMHVYANCQFMNGYGGQRLDNYVYVGSQKRYVTEGVESNIDLDANAVKTLYDGTDYNAHKYTLANGYSMPDGLTLTSDGKIIGKATTPGQYSFKVVISEDIPEANVVTDDMTGSRKLETVAFPYNDITVSFDLLVMDAADLPTDIVYETTELPDAAVGFKYTQSIATAIYYVDGVSMNDISYSLADGSLLPRGLELDENGTISGICQDVVGKYIFSITAKTKTDVGIPEKTVDFMLEIKANNIAYESKDLPDCNVGDAVNISVADAVASSGKDVRYELKNGSLLPKGLSLSSDGVISGTAERACTDFEFTVVATSEQSASAEVTYKMTVLGLVSSDQTFDNQIYGKKYEYQIVAAVNDSESDVEITYTLKEGSYLPTGFSMDEDGRLYGTALNVGTVSFVVECSADGYTTTETTITISTVDLETEDPYGEISSPIDFDELNDQLNSGSDGSGCSASSYSACVVSALIVGFVFAIIKIKNKKGAKK